MILYTIAIRCFGLLMRFSALWNLRARKLSQGQDLAWANLPTAENNETPGSNTKKPPLVWIHCASLGEFEMAKPIVSALEDTHPGIRILFSFFSPSGYQNATLSEHHFKAYLPLDTKKNAKKWIAHWQPSLAIFIKYDFWFNLINETLGKQIPIHALGVALRPDHFLFTFFGTPWLKLIRKFQSVGVINQAMVTLGQTYGLNNSFVFGDPKFNRTVQRLETIQLLPKVFLNWISSDNILILGSCWPAEINLLKQYLKIHKLPLGWKILIAPHDIQTDHCREIVNSLQVLKPILLSNQNDHQYTDLSDASNKFGNCVILDSMGTLAECYRHSKIAFVGGAFGKGLHNIIEAAVFGMPILFGPNHSKFPEAQQSIDAGFGFSISNQTAFNEMLNRLFFDPNLVAHCAEISKKFSISQQADISKFCKSIPEIV